MRNLSNPSSKRQSSRLEADTESSPPRALPALTPEFLWQHPHADLTLGQAEIHVWYAQLEQQARHLQPLAAVLSDDERTRASRYHFEKDRRQFSIRRGLLRMILGRYLRVEPARLRFACGPHGKPALVSYGVPQLRFNLSHSDGLAMYAVAWDYDLGIDVERIRDVNEAEQIAAYFFSARENTEWRSLPRSQRSRAFLQCWTRKEACLKASGAGITRITSQSEVSSPAGEPVQPITGPECHRTAVHWLLCELTPAPGYVAALAGIDPNQNETRRGCD